MLICYLHDCPEYIQAAIELVHGEFGNEKNYEAFAELLRRSMTPGELPLCVAAIDRGELVGAAGILRADLISRQDLYPWLGNLVVRPDRRGEGIGLAMLRWSAKACRELGYGTMYLYTQLDGYYEKLGWQMFGTACEQDGSVQKLYRLEL